MRTILTVCALTLIAGAVLVWREIRVPAHYGTFTGAPKTDVAILIERPKDFLGNAVLTEGEVRQQCKTMGCFFFFFAGGKTLRVDLEPIAMNAPMREGRPARVEGRMVAYGDGYQLLANAVEFQ